MTDKPLDYQQTYYAVASKDGGLKRWSEGGPPVLYMSNTLAARECGVKEFVIAVRLAWKLPRP